MTSGLPYVFRRLRRAPAFTAIAVATLAVGVGANTAIFSVVHGVLLKPLPYPQPERLVGVWQKAPGLGIDDLNASPSTYYTYREEGRAFQSLGVWRQGSENVTGLAEPEQVPSAYVTYDLLVTLGVAPVHGRWFTPSDDQPNAGKTTILGHGYWQRRFGGDPAVIGRSITLDGVPHAIVGVMPPQFRIADFNPPLILPLGLDRARVFVGNFSYRAIARLAPGVNLAAANQDVARMIPMLLRKFPPPPGFNVKVFEDARIAPNVRPYERDVVGDVGKVLWVLMGSIGLLLLIACANVANLMLVRADGRHQELAVRAALGAGWARIARDLMAESLALGLVGGALGVGLASGALRVLRWAAPDGLPRLDEISIDPATLAFALAASLLAGLLFGAIPVFKYVKPHLAGSLREGGRALSQSRERHHARNVLVVVQVALALMLLVGAGLMVRTILALTRVEPGFTAPAQLLTLRISIPQAQVKEPERVVRMHNDILDKLVALPGVSAASLGQSLTMDGRDSNDPIFAEDKVYGESQVPPMRRYKSAAPGFFKTMGNRLVAGRDFNWTETYANKPVVIVSENLARELWGQPSAAIGKRVRENPKGMWREIIGVSGDEYDNGVHRPAPTIVYWPLTIGEFWGQPLAVKRSVGIVIRSTRTGSASFLDEVRQAVWSVNASLPIANVQTMEEIYRASMARTSLTLTIMAISGAMALLLGLVGIYGVISYSVSQRTREIGIRMALGAQPAAVRRMFLRDGLVLTGVGVAVGLAGAAVAMRLMSSLLFGVSAADPVTYVLVPLVLLGAAALACYLPARRASGVAPVEALRSE